jgi:hypothetical protein
MFLRSTSFMGFCADMYHVAQVVHHVPAQYIFNGILRRYVQHGPGSTMFLRMVRTSLWDSVQIVPYSGPGLC